VRYRATRYRQDRRLRAANPSNASPPFHDQRRRKPTGASRERSISGRFVFDAERSRQNYGINMFCMSSMKRKRTVKSSKATRRSTQPFRPHTNGMVELDNAGVVLALNFRDVLPGFPSPVRGRAMQDRIRV
jgi:hypothetical protein